MRSIAKHQVGGGLNVELYTNIHLAVGILGHKPAFCIIRITVV